jgi:hypothetical protein
MQLNLARHLLQTFDSLFYYYQQQRDNSSYRYFFLSSTPTLLLYSTISCQFAAIVSDIQIDSELLIKQLSCLIYILAPGSLVHIGPDLEQAYNTLVSSLIDAYNNKGYNSCYFATMYCLVNVTIIIDCFESSEEIELQLVCFRKSGPKVFSCI